MSEQQMIQMSARNLGELALADACKRCIWIKMHLRNRLPYQIFPGIFSAIDSYTKKVVHGWFDKYGSAPDWLNGLGDVIGVKEPPHHSKFRLHDKETNIVLTGTPDGILVCRDLSHVIVDYKTARFGTQDSLLPLYEVQLNAYAVLGEARGLSPVTGLALIYMEPLTEDGHAVDERNQRNDGFAMGFAANIRQVALRPGLIREMLDNTRELYDSEQPDGLADCRNCALVDGLVAMADRRATVQVEAWSLSKARSRE